VDTDGEGQIGFDEFVVRFGLDFKSEVRFRSFFKSIGLYHTLPDLSKRQYEWRT